MFFKRSNARLISVQNINYIVGEGELIFKLSGIFIGEIYLHHTNFLGCKNSAWLLTFRALMFKKEEETKAVCFV